MANRYWRYLLITIYKKTHRGDKVIGAVSDEGRTYRKAGPDEREIHWSIDEDGRVYLEFEGAKGLLGRVDKSGTVYAEHWRPASGSFTAPLHGSLGHVRQVFAPDIAFQVEADGTFCLVEKRGPKVAGHVEGTSDIRLIGALALVLFSLDI